MSLYLYQNEQQTGPFTEEQVSQMLQAGIVAHNNGSATQTFNMIVGFLFMGGIALNFLAMVLGVIGAFKSKANTLAIIGACLNGFALLALIALMVIGLAAARAAY